MIMTIYLNSDAYGYMQEVAYSSFCILSGGAIDSVNLISHLFLYDFRSENQRLQTPNREFFLLRMIRRADQASKFKRNASI
jgi:hypothetical protein